MANPSLLLCDTDALIQLFLTKDCTKKLLPLRLLRERYKIQPAIVDEVAVEVSYTKTFLDQFVSDLKKATSNGTILQLNESTVANFVDPPHHARAIYSSFQILGRKYYRHVDRGEAYTLAAAVSFDGIALSNDFSALQTLDKQGFALPSPVLRFFDLVAFCNQIGELTPNECDKARQELKNMDEPVPSVFRSASYQDGLDHFCLRLLDKSKTPIGAAPSPGPAFACQLEIEQPQEKEEST